MNTIRNIEIAVLSTIVSPPSFLSCPSLPGGCFCLAIAAVLAPFVIRPNWHWLSCNRAAAGKKRAPSPSAVLFGDLWHCFRHNCHIRDDEDEDDDDDDFATTGCAVPIGSFALFLELHSNVIGYHFQSPKDRLSITIH